MARSSANARPPRFSLVLSIAVAAVALLAGCTPSPEPAPSTPAPTEASPTAVAPAAPALVPEGSAADNLEYFTGVVASVWARGGAESVAGRAYVDALVAAGFDKVAMQVTLDESTVGNPAESIQFAVRWGEECLVGQVGPATGEPVATVLPGLVDGGCLVGQTRAIDW